MKQSCKWAYAKDNEQLKKYFSFFI